MVGFEVWTREGRVLEMGTKQIRVSDRTLKPITVVIKEIMKVPRFWYLTVVIKIIRYLVIICYRGCQFEGGKKKRRVKWVGCHKNCRVVASSFEEPGGSVNSLNTRVRRFFGERGRRVSGRGGSLVPFYFSNDRNRRVLKTIKYPPPPGFETATSCVGLHKP